MSTSRAQVSDDTIPLGSALSSDSAHDGHTVQFYGEDAVLLDELSRFIGDSLEAEGSAVVVATAAHRQGLEQRLEARGIDTVAAAEQGRFVSLDATETLSKFMLEGWPDPVGFGEVVGGIVARAKEAARNANGRLAIFGEMVALLWAQGKFGTAIQLERYWNRLRQTHFFALRCAYPMAGFNREDHSEQFLKICSEHSHVIPGESYMALTTDEERLRNISLLQQRAQALDVATAERKEAQKILRQRESELTDLLENALEGVQRTGPDQKIAWANKAVLKLLGYAPEEYIGHRFDEFFVNQGTFDDFWAKLMRREEVYDYPAELRGKSGAVVHVVIHSNGLWEGELVISEGLQRVRPGQEVSPGPASPTPAIAPGPNK